MDKFEQSELVFLYGDKGQVFYVNRNYDKHGEWLHILQDIDDPTTILEGIPAKDMTKFEGKVEWNLTIKGNLPANVLDSSTGKKFKDVRLGYGHIIFIGSREEHDKWYDEFFESSEVKFYGVKVIGIDCKSIRNVEEKKKA